MPRNGERGFTMIEILVVLLIIAVLAMIAIPLFVNQRSKAHDAEAKTAVTVAAGAMEVYHQDHNTFAGADVAALVDIEPSLAQAPGLDVDADDAGYTLSAKSKSNVQYTMEHTLTTTERTCQPAGHGGCPDAGTW
jgi:prepilin-type N-terminal cleavage/methylation domain-containing protein